MPASTQKTISLPFYLFITLLLSALAVTTVLAMGRQNPAQALACAGLFAVHIGLYWFNLKGTRTSLRWWAFYYSAQTALLVALLLMISNELAVGISVLASAMICIIGEALGLWGNSWRAAGIGAFYFALALGLLYLRVDPATFSLAVSNFLINGGFIILVMVLFNQQLAERQKAQELAETLESTNAKLAAYAAKIETLTLQTERQRMARELHDTLAQGVAGLVLQLEAVKAHLDATRTERAAAIIEQALARARATLAESRAAIDDLRAGRENVADVVREKIAHFTQTTGLPCDLTLTVDAPQLPAETTTHALSILTEALANITRHAKATQTQVKFRLQAQTLELEVQDNGIGFDVDAARNGHYGLLGMRERARLTGGTLTVESTPSTGTRITFRVGSDT